MPELPEVHTIITDLKNSILGYTILKSLASDRYTIHPDKLSFINGIEGRTINNVNRVAKNILLELDNGRYIHFHLAMTGRLLLREDTKTKDNWTHLAMKLGNGQDIKYLKFTDMRMFGKIGLVDETELTTIRNAHGPDALESNLTTDRFLKLIKSKNSNIKNILLDQAVISGIGNIYATDALFMANINPHTKTKVITSNQAEKLLNAIKTILSESIQHRGSTLPDRMYVDIFGKEGTHQKYFRIYMKEKCPTCKTNVVVEKISGRSTYYCPTCQF